MTVRPILLWPDLKLQAKCAPVQEITPQIETLTADMLETMYDAPGRGLAAPQVGELLRVLVMDATWKDGKPDPVAMINPDIREVSEDRASQAEGCLSIPGVMAEVSRPKRVKVAWTGLNGGQFQQVFDGFAAACVQHEIDHLDGLVTFDRLSPDARTKAEAKYKALP